MKNNHFVNKIAKKAVKIVESGEYTDDPKNTWFYWGHLHFALDYNAFSDYEKLCMEILKHKKEWKEKISIKYVEDKVEQYIITPLVKNNDYNNAKDYVKNLITDIDNCYRDLVVWIPLAGIKMEFDELEVGNILLRNFNDNTIELLNNKIKNVDEIKEDEDYIRHFQEDISKLKGNIVAEIEINAEYLKNLEKAYEECRRSIDVINYYIPFFHLKGRLGFLLKVILNLELTKHLSLHQILHLISLKRN